MRSKAASYMELVKVPYSFTAMADPLAGLIVASPSGIDIFKLPFLLAASALIYAGGASLESFAQRRKESRTGEAAPVDGSGAPGGSVTLGSVLIISGIAASTGAGLFPFLAALALSAAVIAYCAVLKKGAAAQAAAMGASRALNLTLGISAGAFTGAAMMTMPAIMFAFVFTASLLASREARLAPKLSELAGWIAACAGIEYLLLKGYFIGEGLLFAVLFHVVSGIAVLSAYSSQAQRGSAAQSLMLSIPLLDASFSSGISGVMAGFPVAAMALPAVALARRD